MKHLITVAFAALATVATSAVLSAAPPQLPLPSPAQADWLDAGIGIFVHWLPNVYQGGEGDNLSTPREKINPDRFDAGKIVAASKSANAGYLIFVAKHVGGYCAWQTGTTDYSFSHFTVEGWHYVVAGGPVRGRYLTVVYPGEVRNTALRRHRGTRDPGEGVMPLKGKNPKRKIHGSKP